MKPLWADAVSLRRVGVAACLDLPRLLPLVATRSGWTRARNRHERLQRNPEGAGWRCDFEWTSGLNACAAFPWLGRQLMSASLAEWPIRLADRPVVADAPRLSVLLPFRGEARLPLLQATLRSWLAQQDVAVECIVIEQSNQAVAQGRLPAGVRHVHLPHPQGDTGWRKSWAYNVGAKAATTDVLVCHDADILVPQGYSRAILEGVRAGFESLHLQRFLHYLTPEDSARIMAEGVVGSCTPADIRQNWLGGTLAIRKDAYFRIGGFDERFVDWGGEDNEFFDRCTTLRQTCFGFLPFVHLWHAPQPNKFGPGREAAVGFMRELMAIAPQRRIADLQAILQGLHAPG